ncbi:MAG: transglutaminase domain-containing protein [Planctomycetota bacterium]|nr:MAG: transglutaminase domain-containing protein [Planctomycetota bacterium]
MRATTPNHSPGRSNEVNPMQDEQCRHRFANRTWGRRMMWPWRRRRRQSFRRAMLGWLVLGLSACLLSCQPPSEGESDLAAAVATDAGSDAAQELHEWVVIYMQGNRVGHVHTVERPVAGSDAGDREVHAEMVMKMKRFDQMVETKVDIKSREDADGKLQSFETTMRAGPLALTSTGVVEGDELQMELNAQGQTVKETLAWTGEEGGFFERERSLHRKPMKPGEERTLKMLAPLSTTLSEVHLKAVGLEETELLTGKRKLLRIDAVTTAEQAGQVTKVQETLYCDRDGFLVKSVLPTLQQVTYRTTREVALGDFDPAEFDFGQASIVKVTAPADLLERARVRYRVSFESGDPNEVFRSSGHQVVTAIDERTARIRVEPAILVDDDEDRPDEDDRAANALIQSDDARIVAMAAKIAPQETDATKLAVAIEKYVYENIDEKNFSQVFSTAADVAESLEGDCTEHAVLLAALARARELPARVAIGLIYAPQLGGFGYHMWSEVWTGEHWLPLDGTLGRGGITAGHIKITHANLKGAGPLAAMMPVVNVMGNLRLEVVE